MLIRHPISIFQQTDGGIIDPTTHEIYFMGIIDILQPYNLRKRIETGLKGLRYDKEGISAVAPDLYARRFVDFMKRVTA